jgi:hypothetical protein
MRIEDRLARRAATSDPRSSILDPQSSILLLTTTVVCVSVFGVEG